MNRFALAAAATIAGTAVAHAGGLDRSGQSVLAIFDPADTLSFSISHVSPDITGVDLGGAPGTYDVGNSYTQYSFSYANEVNDQFSYAVIADQPFGADVFYNAAPGASNLGGTKADLSSDAISFIGKYQFSDRVSVFGGLRAQRAGGQVALNGLAYSSALGARAAATPLGTAVATAAATPGAPNQAAAAAILGALGDNAGTAFAGIAQNDPATAGLQANLTAAGFGGDIATAQGTFAAVAGPGGAFIGGGGYSVDIEQNWGVGLTLGAAYEIPEIALRLAVTYHSEVSHDGAAVERIGFVGGGAPIPGTVSFATPQSVNVEFQTGINQKTLLLASMRWTDWDDFDVIPPNLGVDLANIDDSYRWTVGVARRFSDELVGLASLTYEKDGGGATLSPLGPTDGQIGLSLGARYTSGNLNISGGINYTKVGSAFAGVANQPVASFTDNSVVGVGLKVAYQF